MIEVRMSIRQEHGGHTKASDNLVELRLLHIGAAAGIDDERTDT